MIMFEGKYEFTGSEAAKYLGVSNETFYRYVREKRLVMLNKPSGKRYITKDLLDGFKNGTLTTEQLMNYSSVSTVPLSIKVYLENAKEYPEFSDKTTKYYDISNPSIKSEFTDLRVERDGIITVYTLGKIEAESGTFKAMLEWVD